MLPWQMVAALITKRWIIYSIFHESSAAVSFLINSCAALNDAWIPAPRLRYHQKCTLSSRFSFSPLSASGWRWELTSGHTHVHVVIPNKHDSENWRNSGALRFPALIQHCICRITWPHKYLMRFLHTLLPLWLSSCPLHSNVFPCRPMGSWTSYSKSFVRA